MIGSKYFKATEFRCRDGTPYPEDWGDRFESLTSQLDVIREAWDAPVVVISGYRTATYNKRVGGARDSQHVQGRAADIRPAWGYLQGIRIAWDEQELREKVDTITAFGAMIDRLIAQGMLPRVRGVGIYPGRWVHVDVRSGERVARWTGNGIGSEKTG